jgi:hypothetical protein
MNDSKNDVDVVLTERVGMVGFPSALSASSFAYYAATIYSSGTFTSST